MSASAFIFYAISACVLGAAILAVTSVKIFRSAIWLLFSLVGIAGLYFWMQVEFVAAVQIIVYVGGIVVLIIFSIFLTQESGEEMTRPLTRQVVFSVLTALFGFAFTYNLINKNNFQTTSIKPFNVAVSDVGSQMLSTTDYGYILPFEVVSMLLLSAMIGCIVIAMKTPNENTDEAKTSTIDSTENTPAPSLAIVPPVTEPELIIEEV